MFLVTYFSSQNFVLPAGGIWTNYMLKLQFILCPDGIPDVDSDRVLDAILLVLILFVTWITCMLQCL